MDETCWILKRCGPWGFIIIRLGAPARSRDKPFADDLWRSSLCSPNCAGGTAQVAKRRTLCRSHHLGISCEGEAYSVRSRVCSRTVLRQHLQPRARRKRRSRAARSGRLVDLATGKKRSIRFRLEIVLTVPLLQNLCAPLRADLSCI